jgi:hypothetical protein
MNWTPRTTKPVGRLYSRTHKAPTRTADVTRPQSETLHRQGTRAGAVTSPQRARGPRGTERTLPGSVAALRELSDGLSKSLMIARKAPTSARHPGMTAVAFEPVNNLPLVSNDATPVDDMQPSKFKHFAVHGRRSRRALTGHSTRPKCKRILHPTRSGFACTLSAPSRREKMPRHAAVDSCRRPESELRISP